ncbi:MAG: hypothetical protein ACKVJK_02530 [Methylophagaceae bacterium]
MKMKVLIGVLCVACAAYGDELLETLPQGFDPVVASPSTVQPRVYNVSLQLAQLNPQWHVQHILADLQLLEDVNKYTMSNNDKTYNSSQSETRPNTNWSVNVTIDGASKRGTVTMDKTPPSTRDPQKDLVKK